MWRHSFVSNVSSPSLSISALDSNPEELPEPRCSNLNFTWSGSKAGFVKSANPRGSRAADCLAIRPLDCFWR